MEVAPAAAESAPAPDASTLMHTLGRTEKVKTFGAGKELANALTMLPLSAYVLSASPRETPLSWILSVVMHGAVAVHFHLVLFATQRWPHLNIPSRRVRAALDLDMVFIHISSAVALVTHASESTATAALALALNAAGLVRIWRSRALPYGPALEHELVSQRYPLIFTVTMYEALLVAGHGDYVRAGMIAAYLCATCTLVLVDRLLGGWGHPLAHVVLLPGLMSRTEALAAWVAQAGS